MEGSPRVHERPRPQAFLLLLVLFGVSGAGLGARADALDFPLEQARRDQRRETTAAAMYRAALAWPVGETARDEADRWWISASAGIEYDSDVVLFTNTLGPPREIDEHDHAGGTWFAEGGVELFRSGRFSGGLLGSYWGNAYTDLDGFDTHFPTIGTWLDVATTDDTVVRLRYDGGYAWVDGGGYAESHHAKPSLFIDWDTAGDSQVFAEYYYYDFDVPLPDFPVPDGTAPAGFCSIPASPLPCGPDERSEGLRQSRTGWGFTFGGEHRKQFEWNDTQLRVGYFYQHYIPHGAEFHNQSHQLWIGTRTALPLGFTLDAETSFVYQSTRNQAAFPDPDRLFPNVQYALQDIRRHDFAWNVSTVIGRPIVAGVSASLEYAYTHHDSNYEVFDFDAHRVGAYLTFALP